MKIRGIEIGDPSPLKTKFGEMAPLRITARLEIKGVSDTGEFEGYGSVFAVKDSYSDIVDSGAFLDSLAQHDADKTMPALLWQHDPGDPRGVWLEMKEDSNGLRCLGQFNMDDELGIRARSYVKQGAVRGLSIGFVPVLEKYDSAAKVTHIQKLTLWECSVVTFAANPWAEIDVVKSSTQANTKRTLEDLLRDVTNIGAKDRKAFVSAGYKAIGRRDDDDSEETGIDAQPVVERINALTASYKASRNGPHS